MSKAPSKVWLGFAAGLAAGVLMARKSFSNPRMPNAKTWQKLLSEEYGQIEGAAQIARSEQRYVELVSQSGVFESKALQSHLLENILPMLALYQTWRSDGLDQETALARVDALYQAQYETSKKGLLFLERFLVILPGGFSTFKSLIRRIMTMGFPAPGFELTFIPEDDHRFGFDIHRCFYQDVVSYHGAPELTASFCKVDFYTMQALPEQIRWSRSGTLGTGAACCDFRWEYMPDGYVPVEQIE